MWTTIWNYDYSVYLYSLCYYGWNLKVLDMDVDIDGILHLFIFYTKEPLLVCYFIIQNKSVSLIFDSVSPWWNIRLCLFQFWFLSIWYIYHYINRISHANIYGGLQCWIQQKINLTFCPNDTSQGSLTAFVIWWVELLMKETLMNFDWSIIGKCPCEFLLRTQLMNTSCEILSASF